MKNRAIMVVIFGMSLFCMETFAVKRIFEPGETFTLQNGEIGICSGSTSQSPQPSPPYVVSVRKDCVQSKHAPVFDPCEITTWSNGKETRDCLSDGAMAIYFDSRSECCSKTHYCR